MLRTTAFDVLTDILVEHGVERAFGIPGDAINGLIEAIRKDDRIEFVQVRHEEAGALAASAHAKLTGRLSVCAGTAGPGALHLLNGLYDARMDHAPVLALTGQVATEYLGNDYHQEVDTIDVFRDVARYNEMVVDAAQMARQAGQACRTALTRSTVAHLSIPEDVGSSPASGQALRQRPPGPAKQSVPADGDLQEAAAILNAAEKVVVLAGIGASEAEAGLLDLLDRLKAPLIKTLRSKDLLHDEHPSCLGFLGLLGTQPALDAVSGCDALFMIGTDFPYEEFYPDGKRIVQLDIDAERLGRRCPIDVGLSGDAAATLELLLPLLEEKRETSFLRAAQEARAKWVESAEMAEQSTKRPLRPQAVARRIGDLARRDAVFVCDTGTVTVWAARHLRLQPEQRFTLSSSLGTMAFALPGAIGAQFAWPDRQVVAICGDGGFSMLMADFMTAVKYELPLTAVVFNNRKLGLIQMEQEASGLPEHKTGLHDVDYAAFARLCGGQGARVDSIEDLEEALARAYASSDPWVIDVEVCGEELTRPPRIEFRTALHFAVAKVREFMGQGEPDS